MPLLLELVEPKTSKGMVSAHLELVSNDTFGFAASDFVGLKPGTRR